MKKTVLIGAVCAVAVMAAAMVGCGSTKEDSASATPADSSVIEEIAPVSDPAEPEEAESEEPEAEESEDAESVDTQAEDGAELKADGQE